MGQGQSAVSQESRSHEQLVRELANRFAEKCFSPLELYSLKDNFRSLADRQQDVRYLREDTMARFLEIPDILHASPVVFHMVSCLGAFPFLADAPVVLGLEQLVIVVTLLTDRYRRVLVHGASDRRSLLFRSLAVHDRVLFSDPDKADKAGKMEAGRQQETSVPGGSSRGFAIDAAVEDEDYSDGDGDVNVDGHGDGHDDEDDYEDDDDLVLAALSTLDYTNPRPTAKPAHVSRPKSKNSALHDARIPADNFRKLVLLLLLVAPLAPQEQLSRHVDRVSGNALESLRATAECVLATFLNVETSPGIRFPHFDAIVPVCFPYLFNGFNALFEHFLFSKNLDFSKPGVNTAVSAQPAPPPPAPPLLLRESDDMILDLSVLSQLSFFLPGASLFHRLRLLYSGDNDGFSMGSFESKVFNWRAPTILLVRGTRVGSVPRGNQEAAFAAALPPRRLPAGSARGGTADGEADDDTVVFGAYISQPWRLTNRDCFGDSDCMLFQLAPVHDVFAASTLNHDYATFVKPTAANQHAGGIAFGCPAPSGAAAKAMQKQKVSSQQQHQLMAQGPLSLLIDAGFEFGVMTHAGGGGAFHASVARLFDFQERFAIDALEVWGCGGDGEAKAQAERWAWEAREAEARRRINLGTGDMEADRQLLEMAGLIGQNRSGGSMA
ncbi:tldc domain containing protein 2 [Grosmannia clavigera kw1407]|uniref:Restriction of telomere capping protein 5 n=1 Tax=Grosmannia clavigera (strain kw1407 / UAMH 11150) TaxID=655863 RepID=F0XAD4_GROCL|nr:tldc domain containing protein 2 [Grosmannia clavigera kw1407]EFX05228.1 tldc domain containing protein 2 [Grosmannia clavigera kw1407]